uniref:Uncharacterized protein n=1 Tax=Cacopsylla melanoneura TaxID=428564 RepID=A0A8D8ZSX6_9HEMI
MRWYTSASLRKFIVFCMASWLSSRFCFRASFILCLFLRFVKAVHSWMIWLIVSGIWMLHLLHIGGGCFSMRCTWVSLECPILNLASLTSSPLVFWVLVRLFQEGWISSGRPILV